MTMPLRTKMIFLVGSVLLFGAPQAALAACDQTLSVGANIATVLSSAANGTTICLGSGNYGTVTLTNIARTGFVTIRSTAGVGAQMSPRLTNVDFVKFESLTLTDARVSACSTNIHFLSNTFVPNTSHLHFNDYSFGCGSTPKGHVVDGNTFVQGQQSLQEGRLTLQEVSGVTLTNNLFSGSPTSGNASDGIQITGNADNITIGPGNIFENIHQSECIGAGPPHCDSIQIVGGSRVVINGNWFRDVEVPLQHHDAGSSPGSKFTNNVIQNAAQFWVYDSAGDGFVFEHNTVYNLRDVFVLGNNGGGVVSTGVIGRSNIILNSQGVTACSSGCTYSHNLGSTSGQAPGTNAIIGTPTFIGGSPASITTWAGWQLANGSLGENNGQDGLDRGTLYYGSAPPVPQEDPTISITSPTSQTTYDTAAASVALSGTCTDNGTVTLVSWANDRGGSGTATGTTSWSISSVGLSADVVNNVTVTCTDNALNTATAALSILRVTVPANPTDAFTRPTWATLGANWTNQTTVILTGSANQATATSATTRQCAFWNAHSFAADHYSQVVIVGTPTATRITYAVVRAQGAGAGVYDHYQVTAEGTTSIIAKVINETRTELQTITAVPWANGDTIRLEAVGNTLRAYRNGGQIGSDQASGGELTTGSAGACGYGSGAFDNFLGGNLVAPPPPPSAPRNLRTTP